MFCFYKSAGITLTSAVLSLYVVAKVSCYARLWLLGNVGYVTKQVDLVLVLG